MKIIQFNCKSLFNFWKKIYSFENRKLFSGFKLFILACTFVGIRLCRALEFVGSLRLLESGGTGRNCHMCRILADQSRNLDIFAKIR
jgi:hypothetical protein